MIVLSRKQGQSIQISDNIDISVVRIRGQRVLVGIRANAKIPIHRVDGSQLPTHHADRETSQETPAS